jgi:hypothetical protein
MEQRQRWTNMAGAMDGSSCRRSASDEPRSGKRQKPNVIHALRHDLAIPTAMRLNLNRVLCIDCVVPSCSSRNHGYRLSSAVRVSQPVSRATEPATGPATGPRITGTRCGWFGFLCQSGIFGCESLPSKTASDECIRGAWL